MLDLTALNLQMSCECNKAIAIYTEAAYDYEISCNEVELAVMQDPILTESADVLYENAFTDLVKKTGDAIASIFKAIGNFIIGIGRKIKDFFTKKKPMDALDAAKNELKDTPEAASEKVEVFDLTKMTEDQVKHFTEIQALLIKSKDGDISDEEAERINKFYANEFDDLESAKVEVPVSKAIEITRKAAETAEKATAALSDMAARTKIKAEEQLSKAAIAGDGVAISGCTKVMSQCQKQISKLASERVKILAPIEKNISTIESAIKKIELKVSTNKTDAKYGSNVFKKFSGRMRSKSNDNLESQKKALEDHLKDLKSDVKDVNRAYDAKIASEQKTYDDMDKKAKDIMRSIDRTGSKKL